MGFDIKGLSPTAERWVGMKIKSNEIQFGRIRLMDKNISFLERDYPLSRGSFTFVVEQDLEENEAKDLFSPEFIEKISPQASFKVEVTPRGYVYLVEI